MMKAKLTFNIFFRNVFARNKIFETISLDFNSKKIGSARTIVKKYILAYVILLLGGLLSNAQTFVTVYSESFETISEGTLVTDIDFSYYGQGASIPIVSESIGNGAEGSNRFITTIESGNILGIQKFITLKANRQYKFSNAVKRTLGLTSNPIRITRSSNVNYHNEGAVVGTGNWQVFNVDFTALADEEVQFVTVKQADGGIISLDNVKLQIEGIAWTGTVSTNWHTAGNWEGNTVPTADDYVLITNVANKPIINDAEVRVSGLEVADGSKLVVQNNKPLIVNGQLTGDSGYVELLAGSTLFADRIVGDNHIIPEVGTFSVNSIFQSHMVLQRQQPIPIYGKASDGLSVSVTLDGITKTTTSSGGKWEVIFDAKEAGGGALNLSISGTDTYDFSDILMGDVWICGGQSNMQQNIKAYKERPENFTEFLNEPGTYQNDNIRLLTVEIVEANSPQDNVQINKDWVDANPTSLTTFSATGYFFGKYLQPEINIPVGLVTVARGGTGMGSFIPIEDMNSNNFTELYDFEAVSLSGPSTLYNGMVHPLTKQKIKGIIWYQGEHETNKVDTNKFSSIFTTLINSWRTAWGQGHVPFIFTQLPGWGNVFETPIESKSAEVRQQQLNTWNSVNNTGMAVSIDGGMKADVHPPNKEDVGSRLALFARKMAYEENITFSGPTIREVTRINGTDKAIVKFKNFDQGIESRGVTLNTYGDQPYNLEASITYGFEVAGTNNVFHKAIATIENDSVITLTSRSVLEPLKVRYGWSNFPLLNLYNNQGLPASPFEKEIAVVSSDNSLPISSPELITYNSIPGRTESDHYVCRIKLESEPNSAYRDVFELQTTAKVDGNGNEGNYFDRLANWTATWITFESNFSGDNVVVEIAKKDGSPITKAMVRPVGDASSATITNGKAYVTFTEPANVNVDINGQLEDTYTGYGYNGDPVHTISLFANPIFERPDENDSQVLVLQPGETIPTDRSTWQTIVFAPGVHNLGVTPNAPFVVPFQIQSDETLYIPGDAVVNGTIHPVDTFGDSASQNFTIIGSGTLSGEEINREIVNGTRSVDKKYATFTYQAEGARLEGFVVADPPFHTFNMGHSRGDTANPNIYKNLKILSWRVNSDGINAFRNSEVTDCFFRTQDDAFYLGSENVNQHNNVVWNDANGAVLFLQNIEDGSTNTFENVTVIYHRASWHWWSGGKIVSMRETSPGANINNVHVKNILVEDPFPAFAPFYFRNATETDAVASKFNNIILENIRQEHPAVTTSFFPSSTPDNQPTNSNQSRNTIWGNRANATIGNIWFKNCYYDGNELNSLEDGNFLVDEFIDENKIVFTQDATTKTFDGETNAFWNLASNWSDNGLPSNAFDIFIPSGKNVTITSSTSSEINDLIVHSSGSLTIEDGGNLIVNGKATGSITYKKTLPSQNWHLMAVPVGGLTFDDTFVSDNNIDDTTSSTGNRGIATYTESSDTWTYLQSANSINSIVGKGYSIKQNVAGTVSFTGDVNTGDVSIQVDKAGNGFNLIGNPYATALNINTFLSDNSANLESQSIWVWDASTGNYVAKNLADNFVLAPTQGFFIKSSNGNSVSIGKGLQTTGGTFQKSATPKVILTMTDGTTERFARILYSENATTGFDNGYDSETFGGIANTIDIYTNLLSQNEGKKYQVQSLPNTNFEEMIIPIGVIAAIGKELNFSTEASNLPPDVKVYLEDRQNNNFIRLDKEESQFKIKLATNLNGTGRFYLHTKKATLNNTQYSANTISMYTSSDNILKINGINKGNFTLKIHTLQGKKILERTLVNQSEATVKIPNITSGIYLVELQSKDQKLVKKIIFK